MRLKILLSSVFAFFLVTVFVSKTSASEGTFEVYSTQGLSMRCYLASIQMLDRNYSILVSCRDIIYPAQGEVFSYVMWANPVADDKPVKLGELGLGRATFKTKKAFDSVFVTTETSKNIRSPKGTRVMEGFIEPIPLLEIPPTPTLEQEGFDKVVPDEEVEVKTDSSSRQKVVTGLRRAGLIIFVALVTMVGLIFIITRTRR